MLLLLGAQVDNPDIYHDGSGRNASDTIKDGEVYKSTTSGMVVTKEIHVGQQNLFRSCIFFVKTSK